MESTKTVKKISDNEYEITVHGVTRSIPANKYQIVNDAQIEKMIAEDKDTKGYLSPMHVRDDPFLEALVEFELSREVEKPKSLSDDPNHQLLAKIMNEVANVMVSSSFDLELSMLIPRRDKRTVELWNIASRTIEEGKRKKLLPKQVKFILQYIADIM